MKKKLLTMFLLSLVLISMATGCSKDSTSATTGESSQAKTGNFALGYVSKKKSGFVIGVANSNFGNAYKTQLLEDCKVLGEELKKSGVLKDIIIQSSGDDAQSQIAIIESMINQNLDAIIIAPLTANSLSPVITKAIAKGILVMVTDRPDKTPGTINMIDDNDDWTNITARWMVEQLGRKGKMVKIGGIAGSSTNDVRERKEKEIFSQYPEIEILADTPGGWDPTKAQQIMSTYLTAYKDFDGLYAYECMQSGIIQACKAAGRELPTMIGDYTYGFLRQWKNDYPNLNSIAVVHQPGSAATTLKVAIKILQGEKLNPAVLTPNPVAPGNINYIPIHPAYAITKDGNTDEPWMEGIDQNFTKAISLDEILEIGKDLPDSATVDYIWSNEQVNALFIK